MINRHKMEGHNTIGNFMGIFIKLNYKEWQGSCQGEWVVIQSLS